MRGAAPPPDRGRLLRVLGLAFGLSVLVGNTIGVGILRTPGVVAGHLPSVPLFLLVWLVVGAFALLGALCLSELGAMLPRSGGQYVFVRRAFGPYPGFVVGYGDWLSTCGSMAAVAMTLGTFAAPLVPALSGHEALTGGAVVVAFALLQWRGIRIGDAAQQATSLLKVLALLVLLVAAVAVTPRHAAAPTAALVPATAHVLPAGWALAVAMLVAMQAAIFTYDGWTGPIYFGEEVQDPGRNLPRAMQGGVLLVLAVYLALNLAFLRVVPIAQMAGDEFVVATVAARLFGHGGDTMWRVLALVALLSSVNALQLIASRVPFALARDELMPAAVTRVNAGGTPVVSLALGTVVTLGFLATHTFDAVIAVLAFFFVANYALSFASLLVLRRRAPDLPRPYRVPGYPWVPALALAAALAFLVGTAASDPRSTLAALLLAALSLPIYLCIRRLPARDT